jgi:TldD protein
MSRWTGIALVVLWAGCGARPRENAQPVAASPPAVGKKLDLVVAERGDRAEPAPILVVLDEELRRAREALATRSTPPYFIAYQVTDRRSVDVTAAYGALIHSDEDHRRLLDVELRVGDYKLDSSHALRGRGFDFFPRFDAGSAEVPLEEGDDALRNAIWTATSRVYGDALERMVRIKAEKVVKVAEEDQSDDFSREPATTSVGPLAPAAALDRPAWERRLKAYSAMFRGHPEIHESSVQLSHAVVNRWLVSSEGTRVQAGQTLVRLFVTAQTTADDGMQLSLYDSMDAFGEKGLPGDAEIRRRVEGLIDRLLELRRAPLAEPYTGPAILEGHAAGVYFHEIFGHRVEGHRQKDEEEGQTFARKIGAQVMPAFIDVYDDPRAASMNGVDLNGHYLIDDEGVPARRAVLVAHGVLKGFLMSRSPARGFNRSNGHGRRQEGSAPVARQGNLIVDPAHVVSSAELKRRLLAEVKRQHKPYGLRFVRVEGGYTNTRRWGSQFFKVLPILVYRVYPDGREEMIRGADLEGTPLTSLSRILAAGGDFAVFNGYCGAESGFVPVSATSPSLLVEQVEIARKEKGQEKPPLLPPPPIGRSDGGER